MTPAKRFPEKALAALRSTRIVGIRSGTKHRFIGIWMVMVGTRLFIRSWTVTDSGWFRAFLENPQGEIQIGDRSYKVRAIRTRSEKLKDAVSDAYAAKYHTPASLKYVRDLKKKKCRDATMELVAR